MIFKHIFRAYDIRGVVGTDLTGETVYQIGQAYGSEVLASGQRTVFIARDGRLSGPELSTALAKGITATGCDVIDLGMVPTPVLYFAAYYCAERARSGVMLTGSHNPKNYNGLKMVIDQKSLSSETILALYNRIITGDLKAGLGDYQQLNIVDDYIHYIQRNVKLAKPLKVVIDAGNGVAGEVAPKLFGALGCEVVSLFCEVNGHFPNHHPDPSKPENLQALIRAVEAEKADVGLAFDGDGDRLGVVTPKGKIIWPDRQLMVYARAVLANHPGAEIVFDVKCSKFLADVIAQAGGKPVMYKTGHSLIKQKLKETQAPLAGEMSGHTFFNDKWYGFDDGLYTGARLLEILTNTSQSVDELFEAVPEGVATPEINVEVSEEEKFQLVEALKAEASFPEAHVIDIDGVRIEFKDAWGLVRASNTTPCLVLRFEALTHEALVAVQQTFRALFLKVAPHVCLPF